MSLKLTAEEIKLRGSLLAKDKDLLKLHKELVFSGVISEEEFWEDRRGLLRAQETLLKQKKGLTSALVVDELKPASTTSGSDVKYVLTPTIIQTIFEQHPTLRKAFNDLVTTNKTLSERDFWVEYFKSKFFSNTSSVSNHLDPYFQSIKEDNENSTEDSIKISKSCDISRSEEDHVSDYIRYERESVANGSSWASLKQFNKHSLRILQSLKPQNDKDGHLDDGKNDVNPDYSDYYIEISDLKQSSEPTLAVLNIQENQLFSNIKEVSEANANISFKPLDLKNVLKSFDKKRNTSPEFCSSFQENKTFLTNLLEANNFVIDSQRNNNNPDSNVESISEETQQLIGSTIEILRHFWKIVSIPGKMTSEKSAKLTRLFSVLQKMEEKCEGHEGLGNLLETLALAKLTYSKLVN